MFSWVSNWWMLSPSLRSLHTQGTVEMPGRSWVTSGGSLGEGKWRYYYMTFQVLQVLDGHGHLPIVCRDLVLCSLTYILVAAVHIYSSYLSLSSYSLLSSSKDNTFKPTPCTTCIPVAACKVRNDFSFCCVIHRSLLTYSVQFIMAITHLLQVILWLQPGHVLAGHLFPSTNIKRCFGKSLLQVHFISPLTLHLYGWLMWHPICASTTLAYPQVALVLTDTDRKRDCAEKLMHAFRRGQKFRGRKEQSLCKGWAPTE